MVKRVRLICNPAARGAASIAELRAALAATSAHGWEGDVVATEAPLHATTLARDAAASGMDIVIACGGDGTVNEVVNGLAGTDSALGVVPGGTANVWAKEVRIPRNSRRALEALAIGDERRVDLGRVTTSGNASRHFILVAGVGFDASIIRRLPLRLKARLGAATYVIQGVRDAFTYRATPVRARIDGRDDELELFWAMANNTRSFGGVLTVAPAARIDDGLLDLTFMRRAGPVSMLSYLARTLAGTLHRAPTVLTARVSSFEVATPGLPVQADGELMGETPVTIEAAPGVLRAIIPQAGLRAPVWS